MLIKSICVNSAPFSCAWSPRLWYLPASHQRSSPAQIQLTHCVKISIIQMPEESPRSCDRAVINLSHRWEIHRPVYVFTSTIRKRMTQRQYLCKHNLCADWICVGNSTKMDQPKQPSNEIIMHTFAFMLLDCSMPHWNLLEASGNRNGKNCKLHRCFLGKNCFNDRTAAYSLIYCGTAFFWGPFVRTP